MNEEFVPFFIVVNHVRCSRFEIVNLIASSFIVYTSHNLKVLLLTV